MAKIALGTYKCSRCGKPFEDSQRAQFVPLAGRSGRMCRDCTQLVAAVNQLEKKLIASDFSIEQEDGQIAKQIADLLNKESSGQEIDEGVLTALVEKLLKDKKRERSILKQLRSLQRKKR